MSQELPVRIVSFQSDATQHQQKPSPFDRHGFSVDWVNAADDSAKLDALDQYLQGLKNEAIILVVSQPDQIMPGKDIAFIGRQFQDFSGDVLMGASAYFQFSGDLRYFYWKHLPRPHLRYNYPDTNVVLAKSSKLKTLLADLRNRYRDDESVSTLSNLLKRYYADHANGCFRSPIQIDLDHEQRLIASTRVSNQKKLSQGWMYDDLLARNERRLTTTRLNYPLNVTVEKGRMVHHLTKTRPMIVSLDQPISGDDQGSGIWQTLRAHWHTIKQLLYIGKVNKWHYGKDQIFRFQPNIAPELKRSTETILKRLESQQPLSFAHYNDGELTFIRDYLEGNHHEEWYGRKQQQYNPDLASRLYEAMKYQKEGYFVGVPCATDHPKLRRQADEIVGDYAYKVQAMSIHHNLAYMPRLIWALRDREVYFFINEYQNLSIFGQLGVELNAERIIQVPFKNSYLEYDRYKHMTFPDGAVVVLTCGMLAKILTKVWYERHDHLTILALGASLDDHIQKARIGFELYPADRPLTRNIHKYRPFLFGFKKRCKECFDLKKG